MAQEVSFNDSTTLVDVDKEKITVLPGHAPNYSACTFCIKEEDHTLGNALRWMIMKNPDVEFCGYSAPHPSEPKIHLRIQMYDNLSAISCLFAALANLRDLYSSVEEAYLASVKDEEYVRENDVDVKAAVREVMEQGEERRRKAAEAVAGRQGGDVVMVE